MKKTLSFLALALSFALLLSACGGAASSGGAAPASGASGVSGATAKADAAGEATTVTYFTSKAATDETVVSLQKVAEMYNEQGGNIQFVVENAADRPSYDQKLRTMLTGGQVPDMYDLDPTPFTAELADAGLLMDMEAFLKEIGMYDTYVPLSINYGRLPDGKLYTIPLEFTTEMIWYNTDLFAECGLEKPETFEDLLACCKVLAEKGYTPISIGGADGWPLMRHIAMTPFRRAGNEFLQQLATGETNMSSETGMETLQFMADIGQYYQQGFSSADLATALNLFLDGKSAMYGTGVWELNNFVEENRPEGLNVDYFYMPTLEGAATKPNDYWAFGGIGLTVNPEIFEGEVKDFFTFIVKNYSSVYMSRQHFAPQVVEDVDTASFDPLFLRIKDDIENIGDTACRPWDVVLHEDVVATLNDNLPGLCMGEISPEECAEILNEVLAQHATGAEAA